MKHTKNMSAMTKSEMMKAFSDLHEQFRLALERIKLLEEENARLKKKPSKPDIKPNVPDEKKGESDEEEKTQKKKRKKRNSGKASKDLKPTHFETIKTDTPIHGAVFKGYATYYVQELVIEKKVIEFKLARWELPDGRTITEEVPQGFVGSHFGPDLRKYIIYQHYHNRVPQGKIHKDLVDKGFSISAGQINAILASETENFSKEYNDILNVGLTTSPYINVDDTGARHNGKNGYTTVVCNDGFTYLRTSDSKSRTNFLEILSMDKCPLYTVNQTAFDYAVKHKLAQKTQILFKSFKVGSYTKEQFAELVSSRKLSSAAQRIIEEACLYATCIENKLPQDLIVVSDDAGQFNILVHALCWIHAERALKKLIPVDDEEAAEIKRIQGLIWDYFKELKEYQKNPTDEEKASLSEKFDTLCSTVTKGFKLAPILKKFRYNKSELLVALDHPIIPLDNNQAERSIREPVIVRRISGGTRSNLGRESRDTYGSLFQTCKKNGVSVWHFLDDRLKNLQQIPNLGAIIQKRNLSEAHNQLGP